MMLVETQLFPDILEMIACPEYKPAATAAMVKLNPVEENVVDTEVETAPAYPLVINAEGPVPS